MSHGHAGGDALSGDEEITGNTESRRADRLEAQRFAAERRASPDATEVVVVRSATAKMNQPPFRQRVRSLAEELERAGAVEVATFYTSTLAEDGLRNGELGFGFPPR